jgi:hypothetical protein
MTVIPGTGGTSQLLLVCASPSADRQLLQSRYTSTSGWSTFAPIASQFADSVSLTTSGDTAFMTYLDMASSSQYYASTSTDGINWVFSPITGQGGGNPPAYCAFRERTYMIYISGDSPNQLYVTSCLGTTITPPPAISNPTQEDLFQCGSNRNFWININDTQWRADDQPRSTTPFNKMLRIGTFTTSSSTPASEVKPSVPSSLSPNSTPSYDRSANTPAT